LVVRQKRIIDFEWWIVAVLLGASRLRRDAVAKAVMLDGGLKTMLNFGFWILDFGWWIEDDVGFWVNFRQEDRICRMADCGAAAVAGCW
jgi:hypothetical protein